ncbi:glycolipid transfer protein domain-containing protein [Fennellomyces sp. T-0311]|nr:glycolipid transfer protein domain-containing protein [Fennellomyces sp. T-0311]
MATPYFETIKRSYTDVEIENGINTEQFLEATEGVVKLFDLLGSSAFSVVQNDMNGNITKIRDRLLKDPATNATLQSLTAAEAPEKKRVATEGLLWLSRIENAEEELAVSFTKAYEATLKKYHSFVVRPVFALAMKACPYRKDFYVKIGVLNDAALELMKNWLAALENIINIINAVFKENPAYIKGM